MKIEIEKPLRGIVLPASRMKRLSGKYSPVTEEMCDEMQEILEAAAAKGETSVIIVGEHKTTEGAGANVVRMQSYHLPHFPDEFLEGLDTLDYTVDINEPYNELEDYHEVTVRW